MAKDQDGKPPAPKVQPTQRNMPTKKEKQDISIMETNNSCIVSKRSVERIYHKDDEGFLRYFVKKFQRRSPLINRGYWLRMRAVEHVVRTFLKETVGKKRTVVNLGCGYDPLPFKLLSKHSTLCKDAIFVDVDYKQLMQKKCDIIKTTPTLSSIIDQVEQGAPVPTDGVLIDTPTYKAVACDLEDGTSVSKVLKDTLRLGEDPILFLAEVSITYMDAVAAGKLIEWTSTFADARFAVLEQYLPDGEHHPFAVTMLNHFNKLNSPLKTAIRNPTAEDQRKRFARGNWKDIDFRSLRSLWSDDNFLSPAERRALDHVEPFDEWEEFQLFCSHYFLLVARNKEASRPVSDAIDTNAYHKFDRPAHTLKTQYRPSSGEPRRFGASFHSDSQMWTTGGYGLQSRLENTEMLYPCGDLELTYSPRNIGIPSLPAAVMCHTISHLEDGRVIVIGGRASPSSASAACYLWGGQAWSQIESLPFGLYRHTAVPVRLPHELDAAPSYGVIVFGGKKGPTDINDKWLMWTDQEGWIVLTSSNPLHKPEPRFGATMTVVPDGQMQCCYLTGGIGANGIVLEDFWQIKLDRDDAGKLSIACQNMSEKITTIGSSDLRASLGRFGASLIPCSRIVNDRSHGSVNEEQELLLIGGVGNSNVLSQSLEILRLSITEDSLIKIQPATVVWPMRPMLIGCSVEYVGNSTVVVAYGGAVCFSFGTYWNEGIWTLSNSDERKTAWKVVKQHEPGVKQVNGSSSSTMSLPPLTSQDAGMPVLEVQGNTLKVTGNAGGFDTIMHAGQPLILRGLELGPCLQTWTMEHLRQHIGTEKPVVVHAATSPTMNFLAKDFEYATIPFGDFVDKITAGDRMYMRAISKDTKKPANLEEDYPTIASDFQLPPELGYITANMHSSVLRMSGPVNMWLHFDVQANVYCQIAGEKRLILFPPTDVQHLDFPAGASSSRINIFDAEGQAHYPLHTHPIVFDVKPGDVLFIPPLWLHTAKPTTKTSVAVNVFFRSLQSGYAAGKDVYGNRDLQAYENGRRDVAKITKAFKGLPEDVKKFYLSRLAAEIVEASAV